MIKLIKEIDVSRIIILKAIIRLKLYGVNQCTQYVCLLITFISNKQVMEDIGKRQRCLLTLKRLSQSQVNAKKVYI